MPIQQRTSSQKEVRGRVSAVESSILDYVIYVHTDQVSKRSGFVALLVHAGLIARGAKLHDENGQKEPAISDSILPHSWSATDPIRINYKLARPIPCSTTSTAPSHQINFLQVSVAETDSHIFVNLTDSTTDKFGHLELSGPEHVRLDAVSGIPQDQLPSSQHNRKTLTSVDPLQLFPQLDKLLPLMEDSLWKPVLPAPSEPPRSFTESERIAREPATVRTPRQPDPEFIGSPQRGIPLPVGPLSGYGHRDLDPLGGLAGLPFGGGGMLMDPRNPMTSVVPGYMGGPDVLPPGSVPPGARFDPFGPGVVPPNRNPLAGGRFRPDPDHAMPPGFEDMYL